MTIKELFNTDPDTLAKMTDEEVLAYFKPYLIPVVVQQPPQEGEVDLDEAKDLTESGKPTRRKATRKSSAMSMQELAIEAMKLANLHGVSIELPKGLK